MIGSSSSVGVSAALEKRYAAALEVIGEREEECDELRDRIQHLRAMLDSQAQRISALELAASTSSSHQ